MNILSITEWAAKHGVDRRKAYRWAKDGKLPTVKRKITVWGVPEHITPEGIVNT